MSYDPSQIQAALDLMSDEGFHLQADNDIPADTLSYLLNSIPHLLNHIEKQRKALEEISAESLECSKDISFDNNMLNKFMNIGAIARSALA